MKKESLDKTERDEIIIVVEGGNGQTDDTEATQRAIDQAYRRQDDPERSLLR